MSDYRQEFHRRVKVALLPDHAAHDMSDIKVIWSGDSGSSCDTCGTTPWAEVIVAGTCGCGDRTRATRDLTSEDFGDFMREITK